MSTAALGNEKKVVSLVVQHNRAAIGALLAVSVLVFAWSSL
jgi:hypothetical protein